MHEILDIRGELRIAEPWLSEGIIDDVRLDGEQIQ